MNQVKKRNGTIELMRFVFCILVILYHINNRLELPVVHGFTFFRNGKIGVEFFFLVSGYLMAAHAKREAASPLLESTRNFMRRKLFGVLPFHLLTYFWCLLMTLVFLVPKGLAAVAKTALTSLPNLFLLQKWGLETTEILTPEWYIAAMLWMMLLIYPLILRYRETFTKIACPLFAVFLIGYMTHLDGKLGGMNRFAFGNTVPKAYLRAFAELCGGVFCYEVTQFLRRLHWKTADRVLLTVVEIGAYAFPLYYAVSSMGQNYEAYAFYSLAVAVTLSFSELTLTANWAKIRPVYFLGRFSLPLYFAQSVPFVLLKYAAPIKTLPNRWAILFCVAGAFAAGLLLHFAAKPISRKLNEIAARREATPARAS